MTATIAANGGQTIGGVIQSIQRWQFQDIMATIPAIRNVAAKFGKWFTIGFATWMSKKTLDAVYEPFAERWFRWVRVKARRVAAFFHLSAPAPAVRTQAPAPAPANI